MNKQKEMKEENYMDDLTDIGWLKKKITLANYMIHTQTQIL